MQRAKYRPIPREEPTDDELTMEGPGGVASGRAEAPITVRPPPDPSDLNAPMAASYQNLRNSCRAASVNEPQIDDELAIEAEILRLAMDRVGAKSNPPR